MSMVLAPAGLLCLSLLERLVFCVRMLLLYSIIIQPLNHSQFRSLIEFNYASVIVINIPFILDCSSDTECVFLSRGCGPSFFIGVHCFFQWCSSISQVFIDLEGFRQFRWCSWLSKGFIISRVFSNFKSFPQVHMPGTFL